MTLDDRWRIWEKDTGDAGSRLYFRRAIGELPEMECAKAVAKIAKPLVTSRDRILDVGCGPGHYLRSLKRAIDASFSYTGVDSTQQYIDLARKAWDGHEGIDFRVGDIFALPFEDNSYDLVISSNVLLHLPSVEIPFRELIRVARRSILIRTLVGDRSFRIQEVHSPLAHPEWFANPSDKSEFDAHGEPKSFNFLNIYSQAFIRQLLEAIPHARSFEIFPDREFSPEQILESAGESSTLNATAILGGWQVNGYILLPWHFICIEKGNHEEKIPNG